MIDITGTVDFFSRIADTSISSLELGAQLTMARYAKYMFWATCASVAVSVAVVYTALRSLSISRNLSHAQTRAYVSVENVKYGPNGGVLLYLRNDGQTPATDVEITHANIAVGPSKFLRKNVSFHEKYNKKWSSVANGKLIPMLIKMDSQEIKEFRYNKTVREERLSISGVIQYRTIHDETYVSQFIFFAKPHKNKNQFYIPAIHTLSFHKKSQVNQAAKMLSRIGRRNVEDYYLTHPRNEHKSDTKHQA